MRRYDKYLEETFVKELSLYSSDIPLIDYILKKIIPYYNGSKYHRYDANHILKKLLVADRAYRVLPFEKYVLHEKFILTMIACEDLDEVTMSHKRLRHGDHTVDFMYANLHNDLEVMLGPQNMTWMYNCILGNRNNLMPYKPYHPDNIQLTYRTILSDINRIALLPYDYAISTTFHDLAIDAPQYSVEHMMFKTWAMLKMTFSRDIATPELRDNEQVNRLVEEMRMILNETAKDKDLSYYI